MAPFFVEWNRGTPITRLKRAFHAFIFDALLYGLSLRCGSPDADDQRQRTIGVNVIDWPHHTPCTFYIIFMAIKEFLQLENVSITITPADLKEFALFLIDEITSHQAAPAETYLTPDEVTSLLGVSKNTLWRWNRDGYLMTVKVGRKSLYKRSEVDRLLAGQPSKNNPSRGAQRVKIGG